HPLRPGHRRARCQSPHPRRQRRIRRRESTARTTRLTRLSGRAAYNPRMSPRPFQIHVSDAVLDDLRARLARTRWPDAIPGTGWDYGADIEYIRELCDYWRDRYDWRAHEAALNRFPQYLAEVDGVDIHFYHVRGNGPAPFPLLLLHGW